MKIKYTPTDIRVAKMVFSNSQEVLLLNCKKGLIIGQIPQAFLQYGKVTSKRLSNLDNPCLLDWSLNNKVNTVSPVTHCVL